MWYSLVRQMLFQLDAEKSHYLTLRLLKLGFPTWLANYRIAHFPQRPVKIFNLTFPNPVGLAAGFDKNGDYLDALLGLGFGFVELGTVTPKPQIGNPKPRLFRLNETQALINRMGFNNLGVDHLVEKIKSRRLPGIVGANIGKNSQTPLENAAEDYCECLSKVYPHVNYVTINISSPNTPALRHLQSSYYLNNLLTELDKTQKQLVAQGQKRIPLLIKIDPDLNEQALPELVRTLLDHQVDGVIATNTTINHNSVAHLTHGNEVGGLSGKPLFHQSTRVVQQLNDLLAGKLPIIAVGGIFSGEDALEKFAAGASLVQIYSGMIYKGPSLISEIVNCL